MKRPASILIICLALASSLSLAADPSTSAISNIGFIKYPPKELTAKFPMCDAFLKVEWINKEEKVGYSEYEFYNQGERINRIAHALVYLEDEHPEFEVNLEQFRKNLEKTHKKGNLNAIFEIIRRGEFDRQGQGDGLVFEENDFVYELGNFRSDWDMPLLTLVDHKMNVCIPYPDNQRAYFAEQKEVNDIHEIDRKRAELKNWIPNLSFWDYYIPIDRNSDGKEDYLTGTSIIYSHDGAT